MHALRFLRNSCACDKVSRGWGAACFPTFADSGKARGIAMWGGWVALYPSGGQRIAVPAPPFPQATRCTFTCVRDARCYLARAVEGRVRPQPRCQTRDVHSPATPAAGMAPVVSAPAAGAETPPLPPLLPSSTAVAASAAAGCRRRLRRQRRCYRRPPGAAAAPRGRGCRPLPVPRSGRRRAVFCTASSRKEKEIPISPRSVLQQSSLRSATGKETMGRSTRLCDATMCAYVQRGSRRLRLDGPFRPGTRSTNRHLV